MELTERQHALEIAQERQGWRIDALDEWRRQHVDPSLSTLRKDVNGIVTAEKIAEAVTEAMAQKMGESRRLKLTRVQTVLASLAVVGALSTPVLAATGHA